MSERFYDFDASWEDRRTKRPPPTIRAFGETIELPMATPAAVVLLRTRWGEEQGEGALLSLDQIIELLRHYVGDRVDRWMADHAPDIDQMTELWLMINALYLAGEAEAPETGATTTDSSDLPSKDGHASKPTSGASTAST